MKDNDFKWYGLVRYSKKTGKVDTCMTGCLSSMMKAWALQNTTKTKICEVFELSTGIITARFTGTKDGFPKVEMNLESKGEKMDEDVRAALEASETRM